VSEGNVVGFCEPTVPLGGPSELRWYAIRSRSRHERVVATQLQNQGVQVFLPLVTEIRRWSDRQKKVELPLFPGYAFVRVSYFSGDRLQVLRAFGVSGFVGTGTSATPIPDDQIEGIRCLISNNVPFKDHPFLKIGQRVRIRSGSLSGLEGIIAAVKGSRHLVISVEPIQRSISIRLEGYEIEAI
jgi:transcription termination/antitermination protein NusG